MPRLYHFANKFSSRYESYQKILTLTSSQTEFGTGNAKMCAEDDPDGFTSSVSDEWNLGGKLDIDR